MIKLNKKGDLSINVVIMAAIGVMVMIVMIMIFSGRVGQANKGFTDTQDKFDLKKCENDALGRTCELTCGPNQNHIGLMDFACKEDPAKNFKPKGPMCCENN